MGPDWATPHKPDDDGYGEAPVEEKSEDTELHSGSYPLELDAFVLVCKTPSLNRTWATFNVSVEVADSAFVANFTI